MVVQQAMLIAESLFDEGVAGSQPWPDGMNERQIDVSLVVPLR